jgi:hypothetical protein
MTWLPRIYIFLCYILAAACLWFTVDAWRVWQGSKMSYIVVLLMTCALFVSTALSVGRRWLVGSWLAGISGGLLVLYAASVVLLGWEDVGGARGALPLALGTGMAGALGLVVGIGGGIEHGDAV